MENQQHIGAFKSRGACNAVFSLSEDEAAAGVVAHSSGNHAAALARAAQLRGITAHIVMPHDSATVKIDAVRGYGVEPTFCEPDSDSRQAAADKVIAATGATFIHPFNDERVIAGQGTTALELLEEVPDLDADCGTCRRRWTIERNVDRSEVTEPATSRSSPPNRNGPTTHFAASNREVLKHPCVMTQLPTDCALVWAH